MASGPGTTRFLWDMHYAPIPGLKPEYPIAAVYRNTAPAFTSPWVMPGKYTAVLSVGGKTYTQPFIVQMDPRVKTPARDLAAQFKFSTQLYAQWLVLNATSDQIKAIRAQLAELRSKASVDVLKTDFDALSAKLDLLTGVEGRAADPATKTIPSTIARLRTLFSVMQSVDLAPRPAVVAAVGELQTDSQSLTTRWQGIVSQDIPALNQ